MQERRDPCTNQDQICLKKRKSSRDLENERIRVLLERQKEQILAESRSEIQKHEHQAEADRRSIQQSTGISDSQRMEIDHQSLLQEELSEQIGIFVKLVGIFATWKNCRKATCSRSRNFQAKKLTEDQNTIMELAVEMGSPRHGSNRRRWTREGPESACVQTPSIAGWHTQGGKDELTSCRGTV